MITTGGAEAGIWQPYDGQEPVLTPAMTGGHCATPPEEVHRLQTYLEAVVAERRGPVHTAVAFNAAYFGYELGGEGYGNGAFDLDAFPVLTLGDVAQALPVGALVRVETGSDPLYAEIIYRESRRPCVDEGGEVPAWVSGAPAGAEGPDSSQGSGDFVRRELLVPDFRAFGPALQLSEAKLTRFRGHQKWLNKDGHVVVSARYTSTEEAGRDPAAAFARHLLTTQRDSLLSPLVPVSIVQLAGGTGQERLEAALAGLIDVVAFAIGSSELVRTWDSYALGRTRVAEGLLQDGPLGRADLGTLTRSLERGAMPDARRRRPLSNSRTVYTAIGPWLRGISGAEPLLKDVEYAVSVCRANLAVADAVRGDAENGLFAESGVRVTLDDDFECGGIWRSHYPGSDEEDESDPLSPAGRGWRDRRLARTSAEPSPPHTADQPPEATATETEPTRTVEGLERSDEVFEPLIQEHVDPADNPIPDDDRIGSLRDLRINDSEIRWHLPLRLVHLMEGTLALRQDVRDGLRYLGSDTLPVRVELSHPGGQAAESELNQEVHLDMTGEAGLLTGIEWPIDFFPGLSIHVQWPRDGLVFRLYTIELEEPVEVDGQRVTHRYDQQVLTRENAPGSSRDRNSAGGLDARRLVLRAVRRGGLLTEDGHALLDRAALAETIYGVTPAGHQLTDLEQALEELLAEQSLYATTGSRGADGEPHHPARAGEPPTPLIGYDPRPVPVPRTWHKRGKAPGPRVVNQYFVGGFVRRLPAQCEPTDAQRVAYREHCRRIGKADGWELPRGFTFVTAHSRGR